MASSVGTVFVDVRFNVGDVARQLQTALAGATGGAAGAGAGAANLERTWSQSLNAIATKAASTGRALTVGLTLPIALIGKAATNAYSEYDQAMTQISAINEVPIATTNQWREEVRELGLTYGIAGEEAAAAMYFITSSGVEAADAMAVLDVAAKGAAIGLGETKVVADVLTSALSAYGKENITAAQAGDQLTTAVRLGKGEADELAGSLSQVIPIAANLGVEFGEVAGAMAAMTLSGTSSDQAATQLRGLFNTLQDMPPIAQRALKQYTGLDYAATRLALKNEGLIPTLKAIYDGFDGQTEAMAEVFGNIRALTGVFNLFGQNTERTMQIVATTMQAQGTLSEAWANTAESDSKKLEKAMNTVHDSMIELGAAAIPIMTTLAEGVGVVGTGFKALPGPLQVATAGFATFAAAVGPTMFIFGKMGQGFLQLGRAVTAVSPGLASLGQSFQLRGMYMDDAIKKNAVLSKTFGSLGTAVASVTGILAAGAVAWAIYQNAMNKAEESARDASQWSQKGASAGLEEAEAQLKKNRVQLDAIGKELDEWQEKWTSPTQAWGAWADVDAMNARADQATALNESSKQIQKNIDLSKQMAAQTGLNAETLYVWITAQETANIHYANAEDAMAAWNKALAENEPETKKLIESSLKASNSLGGLIAKAKTASEAFFGLIEAEDAVEGAEQNLADAHKGVAEAEEKYREAKLKTLEADRKIGDAQRKAVDASNKLREARLALADAERELADARSGPSEDEKLDLESAQLSVQQAQKRMRGKFDDALDRRAANIDLRRAKLELQRTRGAHDERIADAEKGVADAHKTVADAVQAEVDANQAVLDARSARTQASKDEATAYDGIAAAQEGVRDAEYELYKSKVNYASMQDVLNTSISTGAIKGTEFFNMLDALRTQFPLMAPILDEYAKKFGAIFEAAPKPNTNPIPPPPPPGDTSFWTTSRSAPQEQKPWFQRAAGGPLSTGQLSTVNERSMPELWSAGGKQWLLPTTNGQVMPLKPLDVPVTPQGHDGVTIGGDIIVQGAEQPVATAYEVRRQLRTKTRTKGRV